MLKYGVLAVSPWYVVERKKKQCSWYVGLAVYFLHMYNLHPLPSFPVHRIHVREDILHCWLFWDQLTLKYLGVCWLKKMAAVLFCCLSCVPWHAPPGGKQLDKLGVLGDTAESEQKVVFHAEALWCVTLCWVCDVCWLSVSSVSKYGDYGVIMFKMWTFFVYLFVDLSILDLQ